MKGKSRFQGARWGGQWGHFAVYRGKEERTRNSVLTKLNDIQYPSTEIKSVDGDPSRSKLEETEWEVQGRDNQDSVCYRTEIKKFPERGRVKWVKSNWNIKEAKGKSNH